MTIISSDSRIAFIGAGSVGKALAVALQRKGYRVVASASRTYASAAALAELVPGCKAYEDMQQAVDASDLVFITSSDGAIPQIASALKWRKGQVVAHCSGASSVDVLDGATKQGAIPATFHPLQTFSSVEAAVAALPGTTFAIEGDDEVREDFKRMALDLGGSPIFLKPEDKPLYHATVVMAGGILNAYVGAVAEQWAHFGIERNQALKALAPIMAGTAKTLSEYGLPAAAAGPYVRGDVGTVKKHIEAMRKNSPQLLAAYCHTALAGLHVAAEKGVASKENIETIRQLLTEAAATAV